uniref:Uncharacterized protein n=1 Tax=Opuntia streptacantha TaxID=393608 RepID=A0A7C8YXD2_OPUST
MLSFSSSPLAFNTLPKVVASRHGFWTSLEFYTMAKSHTQVLFQHVCHGWFLSVFVEKLAKSGANMVVISNSSRRASVTHEKMRSMGFDPSLFLGAITSGELTHQYLERRDDPWFASLGRSCIHMTWNDRGAISLDMLNLF